MAIRPVLLSALIAGVLLTSCANRVVHAPIVDMKKVDPIQYQIDLRECQTYAEQINPAGEAFAGAMLGAAVGAAAGAAIGAPSGNAGHVAAYGAGAGIGAGGAGGGIYGVRRQEMIVNNCLLGRGYKVLG